MFTRTLLGSLSLLTLTATLHAQAPMPTAFTYQGQLKYNGQPLDDSADLVFSLWNDPTGGGTVASYIHLSDVDVSNGLFTVELDFGSSPYNGDARWLQISVRTPHDPTGTAPYTLLSPRQPLTPTPYAAYATYADSSGDASPWTTSGSSIYYTDGNVGIGTASPTEKLHVYSTSATAIHGHYYSTTSNHGYLGTSSAGVWGSSTAGKGVRGHSEEDWGILGTSPYGSGEAGIVGAILQSNGGVLWQSNSGVCGSNSGGYGVSGRTSTGIGVYGVQDSSGNSGELGTTGYGVSGRSDTGSGVYGIQDDSGNYGKLGTSDYGVYGRATDYPDCGVFGESAGSAYGVGGQNGTNKGYLGSTVAGVYGSSTDDKGVRGYSQNDWAIYGFCPYGSTQAGIVGAIVTSGGGTLWVPNSGVVGSNQVGYGVAGRTTNGVGVYGVQDNSENFGKLGTSSEGVYGETANNGEYAIHGTHTNSTSNSPAIYGQHANNGYGVGVHGAGGYKGVAAEGYCSTSSASYGMYSSVSGNGGGIRIGLETSAYGSGSTYGLRAYARGSASNYAIYGTAYNGTTNYAGYFGGNVHVNGTVSKSAGSFKIDHPLDPENKYLCHSFVESPDMMNIYNGNVTTDSDGYAWVTLPDWFQALNQDFRYQLTVIGTFAQAIVAKKIEENRFQIQTDKPNVEVSWQVTGVRHDNYAKANRIPVEMDKPADEQGTYMNAEAFGKPIELQTDYVREQRERQSDRHEQTEENRINETDQTNASTNPEQVQ